MGAVTATVSHSAVMPEVLVMRDDRYLLLRGQEKGLTFWWSPGAYWIEAGTCDLTTTDPHEWIRTTLRDQIEVDVTGAALRGVSLVDADHAPVLTYVVTIDGEPRPNARLGFDEVGFFAVGELPDRLGRDERHGQWLRDLLTSETAA